LLYKIQAKGSTQIMESGILAILKKATGNHQAPVTRGFLFVG